MAQRSSANVMQFNTRLQATRMMQCRSPDKRSAIRGTGRNVGANCIR